jgi:hypothetical protein
MLSQGLVKSPKTSEEVNKLKCLVEWIEIKKTLLKSSRTSEQSDQNEQTQIIGQMNWDSELFI